MISFWEMATFFIIYKKCIIIIIFIIYVNYYKMVIN